MQLPREIQKRMADEFQYVAKRMEATPDLLQKLYLFSALYGEAGRALNQVWDADLALLHLVLSSVYQAFNQRAIAITSGAERIITIEPKVAEALAHTSDDLARVLWSDEFDQIRFYKILARFAELAYVTTGNGYYLYLKGKAKV